MIFVNKCLLMIDTSNGNEEEVDDHFDENAIPDFEERKRKADLVDELTLGEQEEEDLTAEREVYMMEDSVSGRSCLDILVSKPTERERERERERSTLWKTG